MGEEARVDLFEGNRYPVPTSDPHRDVVVVDDLVRPRHDGFVIQVGMEDDMHPPRITGAGVTTHPPVSEAAQGGVRCVSGVRGGEDVVDVFFGRFRAVAGGDSSRSRGGSRLVRLLRRRGVIALQEKEPPQLLLELI